MPENIKYNSVQEICAAIDAIPLRKRVYILDLDGTLLDINHDAPDEITLDEATLEHIQILNKITHGGVVINTGRKKWFVDQILHDFKPRAALEHGVFYRKEENGGIERVVGEVDMKLLRECNERAMKSIRPYDLELEFKSQGIAYHWRHCNQPHDTMDLVAEAVARTTMQDHNNQTTQQKVKYVGGYKVYDMGPTDKADAVIYFMENHYKGRIPIYLGDERADQHAMKDIVIDHYRGIGIATTGVITGPTFRVAAPCDNREIIARNVRHYQRQTAFGPALAAG